MPSLRVLQHARAVPDTGNRNIDMEGRQLASIRQ
jgi:hypothetical protein